MSKWFPGLTPLKLQRNIRDFRRLNHRYLSESDLVSRIFEVFCTGPFPQNFSFPTYEYSFQSGTKFFRVRAIPDDDHIAPLRCLSNLSDAWEPPANAVKMGRLNRPRIPVLYTCVNDPILAFREAKVSSKLFSLIVYRAKTEIVVSAIGADHLHESDSDEDAAMLEAFYDFLELEFTRDVGVGSEYLYRTSLIIAESFFSLPRTQAWEYRSAVDREKFNCAFLPGQGKQCLELVGVQVCLSADALDGMLHSKAVVDFDSVTCQARYHAIGSDRQKELFPEIDLFQS